MASFAPQGETRDNGEQASNELNRYQTQRRRWQFPPHDRLNVWNAASLCLGCKTAHQPSRNRRRGGTCSGNEQKTRQRLAVRPGEEPIPETIRLVKGAPEQRGHETRCGSHEERYKRERKQTALSCQVISGTLRFKVHTFEYLGCIRTGQGEGYPKLLSPYEGMTTEAMVLLCAREICSYLTLAVRYIGLNLVWKLQIFY